MTLTGTVIGSNQTDLMTYAKRVAQDFYTAPETCVEVVIRDAELETVEMDLNHVIAASWYTATMVAEEDHKWRWDYNRGSYYGPCTKCGKEYRG